MGERAHIVVGTAGHVDHGKTALVQALTGVDCDRLPEEKARGITIELGFARWEVSPDLSASIVDVPGHERFVRTMVAGASGIDCVLLVVAADDGVMPQTREHLAVCELLSVATGVIALTKCDLADADLLALVEDDIRQATRGSFLATAEIVRGSAIQRTGLDALGSAVARAWAAPARRSRGGPAYVAVDRAFTKAGAGTVVTGTLVRGALAVSEVVDAFSPEGERARLRIRGMEVHGASATAALAATRVALNLHGDGIEVLRRGAVVVTPESVLPTRLVHAELELLPHARALGRRTKLELHLGTTTREANAVLLGRDRLEPGEKGIARLTTAAPFATFSGQHFIVRRPEVLGERTIGGGRIVDPSPLRSRRRAHPFFFAEPDAKRRVLALVAETRHSGVTIPEMIRRCPPDDDVAASAAELVKAGALVIADGAGGPAYFDAGRFGEAKIAARALVLDFHRDKPLLVGISGAEVRSRCPARLRPLAALALETLVRDAELVVLDGLHRARSHDRAASGRDELLERVLARYRDAALAPPLDDVVRVAIGISDADLRDAITELKRRGALRLVGGLHFDTTALASLRDTVARYLAEHPTLTPTGFKDLCGGITRRHAIPLLEWLDVERLTVRRGDVRVAGPALPKKAP